MRFARTIFFAALFLQGTAYTQSIVDSVFPGIDRFEKNAVSVTRVESDGSHHKRDAAEESAPGPHFSHVYAFKYAQPNQYSTADVEAYIRTLRTPEWTCQDCKHSLKAGEVSLACTRLPTPSTREVAAVDMRETRLTLVHTLGHFDPESSSDHVCSIN